MSKLADHYGHSGNGLAKICDRLVQKEIETTASDRPVKRHPSRNGSGNDRSRSLHIGANGRSLPRGARSPRVCVLLWRFHSRCPPRSSRGVLGAQSRSTSTPTYVTADRDQPYGQRNLMLAWWALDGFAVVPTAALDPPHCAASPAVPALVRVRVPVSCSPAHPASGGRVVVISAIV